MIYTEQSIEIRLLTGIDLSSATSPKIMYEKPNGVTGEWTATVDGTDLIYETSNTDLDRKGVWKFQAYVLIGGLNKLGKIAKVTIDERL